MAENQDIIYKFVIVGDSGVGKTNINMRFVSNAFIQDVLSTIGVEFFTKNVTLNGKKYKLQLWDTAGQERFRAISRSLYHGARGVFLVYDITDKKTFENLELWLNELRIHIYSSAPIFLIGNKCDLEHMRSVSKNEALEFAKKHNLSFLETSAADKTNIDKIFDLMLNKIIENNDQYVRDQEANIRPTTKCVTLAIPKESHEKPKLKPKTTTSSCVC